MADNALSIEVTLKNRRGLHARAAAKIVKTAQLFTAQVDVCFDEKKVTASSIMGLMFLGAQKNSTLKLQAYGPEAEEALEALQHLIQEKFFEDS
jgi:phosphocarrier protein